MFFEDVNTLYEKYKYCSFWYELSYDDIVDNVDCMVDFNHITIDENNSSVFNAEMLNEFATLIYYVDESSKPTQHQGGGGIWVNLIGDISQYTELSPGKSIYINIYCDLRYDDQHAPDLDYERLYPISPLNILKCGEESDTIKVYLNQDMGLNSIKVGSGKYIGRDWDVDLKSTPILYESGHPYVELSVSRDDDEFTVVECRTDSVRFYMCGKILNYKSLPTVTFNTLYRGNTQEILVYFDGELVDSKYYDLLYQNNVLADNMISIDETLTEIELEIYLKHPEYISTKLKYKVPVSYYNVANQSDLETAIEIGLDTVSLVGQSISLTGMEISNIKFVRSSGRALPFNVDDCKFNNCNFEGRVRLNVTSDSYFNDCSFNEVYFSGNINVKSNHLTYLSKAYLNHCTVNKSTLSTIFIVSTNNSEFTDNQFTNYSLIFSDEMITLTGNTFWSEVLRSEIYTEYYPLMLYLTGNFNCKDNQFNINNNYSDFMFSTAVLKTIPETDIDDFIRLNHFNITMNVDNTTYNGLFYCLIDESKLKYKEL